jgi:hypothetical protein
MTSKKGTPFQKAHVLDFALEIVSTDAHGDVTVWCLFCLYQGRDVVEVNIARQKRKQHSDIKYFTKPFSLFKYHSHHEGQHATSWTEYQGTSVDQKKQCFNGRIKVTNTLHHHFDLDKDTYEFFICTEIVDVIIGDLFFHDDEQLKNINADDGEQNSANAIHNKLIEKQNEKKNAMKLFCKEDDVLVYTVTIKDILRFDLAMDYIDISL